MRLLLTLFSAALLFASVARSQLRDVPQMPPDIWATDPVEVDPQHYKQELNTDGLRVLRATFGLREKGRLQSEPERLIVCLTSVKLRMWVDDGESQEFTCGAGQVKHLSASRHELENMADHMIEFLTIEIRAPATPPATTRDP